jgi:serine/threonine-protein kinase
LTLAAYRQGNLPVAMVERLALHLLACARCDGALRHVPDDEDSLVLRLRRCAAQQPAAATPTPPGTDCPPTVAELAGLWDVAAVRLPAHLGQYVLLELLGQGGMGVVFKAQQPGLNRVVAVKLARGPLPGTAAFARLRIESEAIGRLQHENIVRVYECGEHEGRPYFSMDYVGGGNLAQKLAEGPLAEREAAALVQTLARAVQFAHDHHIVHRDLKPANVLLGTDGTVKLTDFSLAKLLDREQVHTQPYAVVGTASYMSPEQARADGNPIGPPADIYGLGAILYEALTGRPPFRGKDGDETLTLVRTQEPVPPSRLRPLLSRDLEAVCLRCLAKEPARRYPSAAALAEDLGRWLRGEPTRARPLPWLAHLYRRTRKHTFGVLVSGLLLCGLVLTYLLRPEPPAPPPDPDQPIVEIERTLSQGQPVSLIEEKGKPRWFRMRLGQEKSQVSLGSDGTFAVHSWGLCLLELVRDPQSDRYRFHAGVRHMKSDVRGGGEVGVYVAHRAHPGARADINVFTQVSFDDTLGVGQYAILPPSIRKNEIDLVRLMPRVHCALKGDVLWDHPINVPGVTGAPFKAAGHQGGPWHDVEVTCTPEGVRATWDGKSVGTMSMDAAVERLSQVLGMMRRDWPTDPLVKQIPPEVPLRGSLGLYVFQGSAGFRSVRVEPLADAR